MHLVDIAAIDGSDPIQNYHAIRDELVQYSEKLAQKPEIIIATKMDLDSEQKKFEEFQ